MSRTLAERRAAPCRPGAVPRGLLIALAILAAVAATGYALFPRLSSSEEEDGLMVYRVERGNFVHEITEKGNCESASNIEVRCLVQSLNSAGTRILSIVPEGTYVQKGERIVQLDSSSLENDRTKQMITRANSRALKIQAENDVKTAKIAKREYLGETLSDALGDVGGDLGALARLDRAALRESLKNYLGSQEAIVLLQQQVADSIQTRAKRMVILFYRHLFKPGSLGGKFRQEEQALESDLFVAEEDFRRYEEYYKYSQLLAAKGYVTSIQLEADRFAMNKAEKARDSVRTKLKVLREYTRRKTEMQLISDIATTKAKLEAAEHTLRLDEDKLALIDDQIRKCTVTAPENGQVVYATNTDRWGGGNEVIIEEGALVRERQVIVRLPDPKRMQVKAKVNESKVSLVAEGQVTTVRLDAFPDMELRGVVQKVNEYPAASAWYAANIKEYETIVRIEESPVTLRPGLTAEVKIRVSQQSDVLQVPVQAVLQHGGKYYAAARVEEGWERREVQIGLTNDKFVVIREGLEQGQPIALNIGSVRDKLDLPEIALEPAKTPLPSGSVGNGGAADSLPAATGPEAKGKAKAARGDAADGHSGGPGEKRGAGQDGTPGERPTGRPRKSRPAGPPAGGGA